MIRGVVGDLTKMTIGYVLMFFYVMFVLGRYNRVEFRTYLAAAGLMSVLLGLLMSFGLLMAAGVKFNTLLGTLPFLALGNYETFKATASYFNCQGYLRQFTT